MFINRVKIAFFMKLKKILGLAAIPIITGMLCSYPASSFANRISRSDSLRELAVQAADLDNNRITTIDEKIQMWLDMGLHIEEKYDYRGGTYFTPQGDYITDDMYLEYIESKGYKVFLNDKTDKYELKKKDLKK